MYKNFKILVFAFLCFMVYCCCAEDVTFSVNPNADVGIDQQMRITMHSTDALPKRATPITLAIEGENIQNIRIPGPNGRIPIRLYIPHATGPFPVFIVFHGGGWVKGDLDGIDSYCKSLAQDANNIVVSVDYRLAPANKFPKPLQDCYAATEWVTEHIHEYGGDPTRIAIGGESAGGNLAAGVTLLAKDREFPNIIGQVLLYPVIEYKFDTDSYNKFAEGSPSKKTMQQYWEAYLKDIEKDSKNPYAAPIKAKTLAGLPPALIILAESDPLFDEGLAYARRLEKDGVSVILKTYPGVHGFIKDLGSSKLAVKDISKFLKSLKIKPKDELINKKIGRSPSVSSATARSKSLEKFSHRKEY